MLLSNELLNQISVQSVKANAVYHEAALKIGLSDSALTILYLICINGGSCMLLEIVEKSCLSKQTINTSLHKLEMQGIVKLETIGKRKKNVVLTEKGKKTAKNGVMKIIEIEKEIYNSWTDEERALLMKLSTRFIEQFKERVKKL